MTMPDDATDAVNSGEPEESTVEEKLFSQADLDRAITQRLTREKAKYEKDAIAKMEAARVAGLSETDAALEAARVEARNEVRAEVAKELVASKLIASLTGIIDGPEEVVEDLDLSKFINEDFSTNDDAVQALKAKYLKLSGTKKQATPQLGHGRQATSHSSSPQEDFAKAMEGLMN